MIKYQPSGHQVVSGLSIKVAGMLFWSNVMGFITEKWELYIIIKEAGAFFINIMIELNMQEIVKA